MRPDDAHKVLRVLQAAFPQYPNSDGLPADSAELYMRMLSETNAAGVELRDFADAMEAVASWVRREDHFPKVGELLGAIQAEARKRAASQPKPIEEPVVIPGDNLERVRQLKAQLATIGRPAPRPSPDVERKREARPPEFCTQHDHTLCGAGPALARPKHTD